MLKGKKTATKDPTSATWESGSHKSLTDQPFGVKVLVDGTDPVIDLVAVHGLDGHPERTWTAENGVLWLRDYLPRIVPNARILAYGYDGRTRGSTPLSCQKLHDHATGLVTELTLHRKLTETDDRPIIFIAHSVGGIIVKDALIYSNSASKKNLEHHNAIKTSTYGILFFSTPHQGADILTWTRNFVDTASLKNKNHDILKNLEKGSELLQKQIGLYAHISSDFETKFFYEAYKSSSSRDLVSSTKLIRSEIDWIRCPREGGDWRVRYHPRAGSTSMLRDTKFIGSYSSAGISDLINCLSRYGKNHQFKYANPTKVVAPISAIVPGATDVETFSINSNHEEMVKYKSEDDDGFKKVASCLRLMVKAAPEKVSENWKRWKRVKVAENNGIQITFEIPFEPEHLRNQSFTGRKGMLDKLHREIRRDQSLTIVVLYGTGGIGKTQIASEYIHAHQKEYQSIFWINAATKETVELGFKIAAQRLIRQHARIAHNTKPNYLLIAQSLDMIGAVDEKGSISSQEEHTECIIRGVKLWFAKEENRNWLLVFDNVDDLENVAIQTFVPTATHGKIIMTSRRTECAFFGAGFEVTEMLKQEGKDLLLRSARIEDDPAVEEVATKLGYLPLAIVQAGAYVAVRKMSLRRYLEIYEEFFSDILKEKPPNAVWAYGDRTVWTTWEISFQAIKEENEEAAELLSLCSFLSNENIQKDMLRCGKQLEGNDVTLENSLKLLFSYSLAQRKGLNDCLCIHPVVHLWASERLAVHERVRKTKEAILLITEAVKQHPSLFKTAEEYEYENRIMAHIEVAGMNIKKYLNAGLTDAVIISGISNLASVFFNKGRWKEAEELQLKAGNARQRILGNENPYSTTDISNLAALYLKQGRWREAEKLLQQAIQDTADKEHPETLAAMSNLAIAYLEQGRWKEAEKMQLKIVEVRKGSQGNEHPDTLTAITNLAVVYWNQARLGEARELQLSVLEARRRILGEEHLDTLGAMNHLAVTYLSQGLGKEAEELQLKVAEAMTRILGNKHPSTLSAISNLARIYMNQGRLKEAEDLELQVVEVNKSSQGEEHPETLRAVSNLAVTYWKQGRSKEAEKLKLQVVEARTRILGNEHPDTLEAMANLAVTYSDQKRLEEALELQLQVVEARKRVLGNEDPHTLAAITNLAKLYSRQGRSREAEELGLQVIEVRKQILGNEHPDTLEAIANLAVYKNQGRSRVAETRERTQDKEYRSTSIQGLSDLAESVAIGEEEMLQRAIGMSLLPDNSEEDGGGEDPDTLTTMNNLIFTYFGQNRWEEAEALGLELLKVRRQSLGNEHPDTLTSMANLAFTYLGQKRWKEAGELGLKVVEARKRILGNEHPDTLLAMTNLGGAYLSQGRLGEAEELALQVVEVKKRTHGNEHPDTLSAMANLTTIRRSQRSRAKELVPTETSLEAEMLERAVAMSLDPENLGESSESVLSKKRLDTLKTMANQAATYWRLGLLEKTEALELQVVKARKQTLGNEHPDTLAAMINLAGTYWELEQWGKAEVLELQIVEVRKRTLGSEHSDTLAAMINLAGTYADQGRWKEAESLQVQVMEAQEKKFGKEHRSTLLIMAILGANYWQQRELKKAEELELQVVEGRQRILGNGHADTLTAMANLAATYASQDRLEDAGKLQQQVFEILLRTLGANHPNTVSAQDLIRVYCQSETDINLEDPEGKRPEDRGSRDQGPESQRDPSKLVESLLICSGLLFFFALFHFFESEHASELKFDRQCQCT